MKKDPLKRDLERLYHIFCTVVVQIRMWYEFPCEIRWPVIATTWGFGFDKFVLSSNPKFLRNEDPSSEIEGQRLQASHNIPPMAFSMEPLRWTTEEMCTRHSEEIQIIFVLRGRRKRSVGLECRIIPDITFYKMCASLQWECELNLLKP